MDDSFFVSALESAIRRYVAPGIFNLAWLEKDAG